MADQTVSENKESQDTGFITSIWFVVHDKEFFSLSPFPYWLLGSFLLLSEYQRLLTHS